MPIRIKRAYEPAEASDGMRILIDRLWPRGVSRKEIQISEWAAGIAPSDELRRWFGHAPSRYPEFRRRFRRELRGHLDELQRIRLQAQRGPVTLVFAARDPRCSNAAVLVELLTKARARSGDGGGADRALLDSGRSSRGDPSRSVGPPRVRKGSKLERPEDRRPGAARRNRSVSVRRAGRPEDRGRRSDGGPVRRRLRTGFRP
ncbi:MAG TPA: DUF488 family protein [Thermoplasmata archaeon]|nr:DUF488 family protein [Thermoplasmata archaeon]